MSDKVYLLMQAQWNGDDIHGAYATRREANATLKAIKAEAAKNRMYEDTSHDLETNLYVQEVELRSAGSPTFTDLRRF